MNPFFTYFDLLTNTFRVNTLGSQILSKYYEAYIESYFKALALAYNQKQKGESKNLFMSGFLLPSGELYEEWLKNADTKLSDLLKSKEFSSSLSEYVKLHLELHRMLKAQGYPIQYFEDMYEYIKNNWNSYYTDRKDKSLTEFKVAYKKDNVRLMHFVGANEHTSNASENPLLIIYAPINQFHIMDIHPNRSVVKSLLSKGIDVYLLDWGYPSSKHNDHSLYDYITYVHEAVQYIQKQTSNSMYANVLDKIENNKPNQVNLEMAVTKNDSLDKSSIHDNDRSYQNHKASKENKISLLGYCWGGIIALCYASLHNDNPRNLTFSAVPVDSSKDQTILSTWAKNMDTDKIIDEFGHFNGQIMDIGFILRNPIRYTIDKYITMTKKYNDKQFMDLFRSVEEWLYNTPNIPGKLFKDIVNQCYKNNSLVKNNIQLNNNSINLRKINIPILTIVAENDDLVSAESTMEIENCVSSTTKKMIKFKGGHVGLCISSSAHKQLWPEVADWILQN
jgi:polyhydroxyalkanoate synthase